MPSPLICSKSSFSVGSRSDSGSEGAGSEGADSEVGVLKKAENSPGKMIYPTRSKDASIAGAGADDRVDSAINYFGADYGINYRSKNLAEEVKKITNGRGVDLVADNIGDPDLWVCSMESLSSMGRLVTAGAHAGTTASIDLKQLYLGRQTIIGSPGCNFSDVDLALKMAEDGSIKAPIIHKIFPLHEASEAHRLVEEGNFAGKILLDPITKL